MQRREFVDILGRLEEKYPVDEWMVDGVHVWPLVKIDLFNKWRKAEGIVFRKASKVQNKPSIFFNGLKIIKSFFYLFTLLLKFPNKRLFLFLGANTHRVIYNGKFINRFFEPIISFIANEKSAQSLILEYQSKDEQLEYSFAKDTYFIDRYIYAARFIEMIRKKNVSVSHLPGFHDFLVELANEVPSVKLQNDYSRVIARNVDLIKLYARIYQIFIRKFSVTYVVSLCYYNLPGYAMNYAAHVAGIKTFEMQHGAQGPSHPAYSGFSKVPLFGFNTMPQVFWCWDGVSQNNIRSWVSKQNYHQVILGGNTWLDFSRENNRDAYEFPKGKKIILYTLQLDEPEEYIIETIKLLPEEFQWWIRIHPRGMSLFPAIEGRLIENGIRDKVSIVRASNYPLPVILSNTFIHISKSSGSIIESIQLGVITMITNLTGLETYQDYVLKGYAISILDEDPKRLHDSILNSLRANRSIQFNTPDFKSLINQLFDSA